MKESNIRRASLAELRELKDSGGLLAARPETAAGEDLGPDFWADATLVEPASPRSVRLNLDPEVFDFFKRQGKGHITRMQNVLKAYVRAQQSRPRS